MTQVPSSFFRHSPIPLHISTALAKPPCALKSRVVCGIQVWYFGWILRDSVMAGASTIFPGLSRFLGIEGAFDLTKCFIENRAEEFFIEVAARQPITVLTGHGAIELEDQI